MSSATCWSYFLMLSRGDSSMRMRKARTIAIVGTGALTAALVATMASNGHAATTTPAKANQPVIHITPGVKVLTQAKAATTPWTTAECQASLGIDCWNPDQLRAAYNEAPLFKKGITGKGSTIVI